MAPVSLFRYNKIGCINHEVMVCASIGELLQDWDVAMAPEASIIETGEIPIREEDRKLRRLVADCDSAFVNATVGIGHLTLTGYWSYVNGALSRILGYSKSEIKGMSSLNMTHADDLRLDADRVHKLITGEIEHYAIDKRFLRSDGTYVWTRKTLVVKRREDGYPEYLIAVIEDIDQRKKAEAENAFLVQELAHRSRNLLSVISSLTSLLSPTCKSVPEFEERLLERLHAIARSNDFLLSQNGDGASINDLVRAQMTAFIGLDTERITIRGPDLMINVKCAHSIGLALYELTSNALKYGALSTAGGRIEVTWTQIGAGLEALFRFEWREYPTQPPMPSGRAGFGTTVLEKVSPLGVRGTGTRWFENAGLVWRLDAPLTAVLAQA